MRSLLVCRDMFPWNRVRFIDGAPGRRRTEEKDTCMNKFTRNFLAWILVLVLSACFPSNTVLPELRLVVRTQNNVTTFSQAGEEINYRYVITNTGTSQLAGPILVTDPPRQVQCPNLDTVGDLDPILDPGEEIVCRAPYLVTQQDVTAGSIINVATGSAGGRTSNQAGLTLTRATTPQPSGTLILAKTSSSQTYGAADQLITYTFTITNTAATPLGPTQFTVTDNKLGAPFNCGPADTTLASNQSISCSMDYRTTAADMNLVNITNSATASGGGQVSAAVTFTVTNLVPPATQAPATSTTAPPAGNLVPGSTVQHAVAKGEWLIQIARCYGAVIPEVIAANPQFKDPDFIRPVVDVVTVPRIGSVGKIYKNEGPCVTFHNVQSGDTWASLAQKYNADPTVLRLANPRGLIVGESAKIPLNSAGGAGVVVTSIPPTAVTPGVTSPAPMRITFEPGSTTASRIGILNPNEHIQYIVAAAQGQLLTINLQAPANEVTLGVNGPTGLALKSPDSLYTWSAVVNTAGDHTINLASVSGNSSKSYTLQVSLTAPAAATSTPGP